jgi:hypothetical protein
MTAAEKRILETKLDELYNFCLDYKVPFVAAYAEDDGEETVYTSRVVTPAKCGVSLHRDYISPGLVMFKQGFKVVPNVASKEGNATLFDMDDLEDLMGDG